MGVITVLCLTYVLSSIFWWTLCTSGFCIAGHSLFRDASMHKVRPRRIKKPKNTRAESNTMLRVQDEADHVEMSGDLEEAPFLNAMEDESNVV